MVVEAGDYSILVGSSAAEVRARSTLSVPGERLPDRDLWQRTRAVDFDDYERIDLVDETKERGDAVIATADGAWIAFYDVDLERSVVETLHATVRSITAGTIEVRLDDPATGPLVASAEIVDIDGQWRTVASSAAAATGKHDVYVVLSKDMQLAELWFEGKGTSHG
jgi:beta-glucosidase